MPVYVGNWVTPQNELLIKQDAYYKPFQEYKNIESLSPHFNSQRNSLTDVTQSHLLSRPISSPTMAPKFLHGGDNGKNFARSFNNIAVSNRKARLQKIRETRRKQFRVTKNRKRRRV